MKFDFQRFVSRSRLAELNVVSDEIGKVLGFQRHYLRSCNSKCPADRGYILLVRNPADDPSSLTFALSDEYKQREVAFVFALHGYKLFWTDHQFGHRLLDRPVALFDRSHRTNHVE